MTRIGITTSPCWESSPCIKNHQPSFLAYHQNLCFLFIWVFFFRGCDNQINILIERDCISYPWPLGENEHIATSPSGIRCGEVASKSFVKPKHWKLFSFTMLFSSLQQTSSLQVCSYMVGERILFASVTATSQLFLELLFRGVLILVCKVNSTLFGKFVLDFVFCFVLSWRMEYILFW